MKKFLICSAAIVGMTSTAFAADLYEPVVEEVPYVATPAAFSWTGLYFGVHGGYGWGDADASFAFEDTDAEPNDHDPDGAFVGAQIGYNWQWNQLVLGVEADYSAAMLHDHVTGPSPLGPTTTDVDIEQLATVRGRVGWAMGQWMPYVTGGWAWADVERNYFGPLPATSDSQDHSGWVAGVGAEYAITNNWTAKLEYMYYDLGEENYDVPAPGGDGVDADIKIHTVRFGINYKF